MTEEKANKVKTEVSILTGVGRVLNLACSRPPKVKITHLFSGRGRILIAGITCALLPRDSVSHDGEWVVPILEVTDDMLAQIDLRDGTTDEWPDLLGEPTLRTIDFKMSDVGFEISTDYDPADLDFAIWLGWNEESDRLYFAGAFVDNTYWGTGQPPFPYYGNAQDHIGIFIDGDHSGPPTESIVGEGHYRLEYQGYSATPWSSEGPNVIIPWVTHASGDPPFEVLGDWMVHPPYCEGGGNVIEGNPAIWVIEFYVTPFDLLVALEPDESVVSDLQAEKLIGLALRVSDKDSTKRSYQARYELGGFFDAILLSRDQADSAVRGSTWGRIKAALEIDR